MFDGIHRTGTHRRSLISTRHLHSRFQDRYESVPIWIFDIDIPPSDPPPLRDPNTDYFTFSNSPPSTTPYRRCSHKITSILSKDLWGKQLRLKEAWLRKILPFLAEREGTEEVKYIHGNFGRGTFTWYGGHDPEDYQHAVGDPPTDLNLHKNSPGYRLILNNVLSLPQKRNSRKHDRANKSLSKWAVE